MERKSWVRAAVAVMALAMAAMGQHGQWVTFGHDAQRSGWARDEHAFTPANVGRMGLAWSAALPVQPRALTALTAPLVVNGEVIVAGASDHVFALDAAAGRVLWTRALPISRKMPGPPSWLCPNNLNATPVADPAHDRLFVLASDGRLNTLSLRDGRPLLPPLRFVPAYAKDWSLNYAGGMLYTTTSQDCNGAHSAVYAMNPDAPGHEVTVFWSAQNCPQGGFCGAGIWGRGGVAADGDCSIYAATGDAAFDPGANEFGSSVLRLSMSLALQDYFTPADWKYLTDKDLDIGNSTPVIFPWQGRTLAAVGGKGAVVYLLDAHALGGPDHHRGLYLSPRIGNDAQLWELYGIWGEMSAWRDAHGQTWLLVPLWGPTASAWQAPRENGPAPDGSVVAFRVVRGEDGGARLAPAWRSANLNVPDPVAIAGGVVFALATGEDTRQAMHPVSLEELARNHYRQVIEKRQDLQAGHAELLALDGETGRTLWSSGATISGWTHFSGTVVGAGKVFVTTHDGRVFAFGLGGDAQPVAPAAAPAASVNQPPAPAPAAASGEAKGGGGALCGWAKETFAAVCANCHGADGKGYAALHTPDFTDAGWQAAHSDAQLVGAITHGLRQEGYMPAFGTSYSAAQIDALARCAVRSFAR
ncbi:MAG TPA: PQQ-binding-like beta-propeller repeat protein [Terriglobales bacterium]|nr:PQQ-binding-like beta-propeller repeat protein [Terriglobales bacterium]